MYDIERTNLLSKESLKIYLYDVSILEALYKKKKNDVDELKNRSENLGLPGRFVKPQFNDSFYNVDDETASWSSVFGLTTAIVGCLLLHWNALIGGSILFLLGYIVGYPILSIILSLICKVKNRKIEEKYSKEVERARKSFEINDNIRIEGENKKKDYLKQEMFVIERETQEIITELNKLYDMDYIHPSDRKKPNIHAVLYYLIDTGRASNLQEALNLYDTAKFRDDLKQMLREIVNMADAILYQQQDLMNHIRLSDDTNKETNRILSGIGMNQERILENQQAIKINTDVINANVFSMRMIQNYYLNKK